MLMESILSGIRVRRLLLLVLSAWLTFLVSSSIAKNRAITLSHNDAESGSSSSLVYLCNTNEEMRQCLGPSDTSTCANIDGDGGTACIASSCGHLLLPHALGVSSAGSSNPLSASAATPTNTLVTSTLLFYSLVPYLFIALSIMAFLATANLYHLSPIGLLATTSVVNDAVLKHVIRQHRPGGSCMYFRGYGMPSGHAATCVGIWTYFAWELLRPLQCQDVAVAAAASGGGHRDEYHGLGKEREEIHGDSISATNNSENSRDVKVLAADRRQRITIALLSSITFLPVPYSRVYLHDHTPAQVIIGSIVGLILGTAWHWFVASPGCVVRRWVERLVDRNICQWLNLSYEGWDGGGDLGVMVDLGESFENENDGVRRAASGVVV